NKPKPFVIRIVNDLTQPAVVIFVDHLFRETETAFKYLHVRCVTRPFFEMVCTISSENLSGSPIRAGSADEAGKASTRMATKASFRMLGMVRPSLCALIGISEIWLDNKRSAPRHPVSPITSVIVVAIVP